MERINTYMKSKSEKVAWTDIDDTIAMSTPVMLGCGLNYYEQNGQYPHPNFDIECEDDLYFADILHLQDAELPEFFTKYYPEYLREILPTPGAKEFLEALKEHGYQINLISSRRDKDGRAEQITRAWLEAYELPYDSLVINCKDKASYLHNKTGFFIDDSYGHCLAVSRKTSLDVIQKKCEYGKACPGVFQGGGFKEILTYILKGEN